MFLYYVRHGEPIYDPDSLTEQGQLQALALSKRFKKTGLDEIYASTSNRAILTATPTAKALNKEIKLVEWAHEDKAREELAIKKADGTWYWCFWGNEYKRLFMSDEVYSLGKKWNTYHAFKGTNLEKGLARVDNAVDEFTLSLGFKHDREKGFYKLINGNNKKVALFAHQGFSYAFMSSLLDIPLPIFVTRFDIQHTGVCVIYFDENEPIIYPKILQYSNDSHLYKEDLSTLYNNSLDM